MVMSENKQLAIKALKNAMGDDLERAESYFKGVSKKRMGEEYGDSGKTRQETLDGYRAQREKYKAALAWLQSIPDVSAHVDEQSKAVMNNLLSRVSVEPSTEADTYSGGLDVKGNAKKLKEESAEHEKQQEKPKA